MVNVRSKEWQQIFQQILRMVILTQGLLITQLLVLGNQVAAGGVGVTTHANVAAFPASPSEGDLAYAEDTDALYLRKASTWERIILALMKYFLLIMILQLL